MTVTVTAPPSGTPTARSAEQNAYELWLAATGRTIRSSLRGVRGARTFAGLRSRLLAAARAMSAGAAETSIPPVPAEAKLDHLELMVGLTGLVVEADRTRRAMDRREVCGASTALARLRRSQAARQLRQAGSALSDAGYATSGLAPGRARTPRRRRANGALLRAVGGGRHRFTVENRNSDDVVAKLVAPGGRTIVSLYVRRNKTASTGAIPSGRYRVRIARGDDWDGRRQTFTRNCSFRQFSQRANFSRDSGIVTTITITLNSRRAGNNATTREISPGRF